MKKIAADKNYRILKSAEDVDLPTEDVDLPALTDSQLIDYLKKHNNAGLKNLQKIIKSLNPERLGDEEFLRTVANTPSWSKAINEAYYKDFPAKAPKASAPMSESVRKLKWEIFEKERDLKEIQTDLAALRQQLKQEQNKQG